MLSLKTFLTASLTALVLPMAASAHTSGPASALDRMMPMISALMAAPAPSARLYRAEYMRAPILRPSIQIGPSIPHLRLRLNCVVAGTPVEFPDDLHIWSDYAVAAGTVVSWNVTGTSLQGSLVLPALAPGQYYFASHVLPGGWPAGSACTAIGH